MRHQQPEKLLLYQFRRLAAQHDLSSAKMCFQLVQCGFDFPPLMIERGQFFGRGVLVIEYGGDQAVEWFRSLDVLQTVIDDAYGNPITPIPPVGSGRVNPTDVRAVWQSFFYIQASILARAPEQVRSCFCCHAPEFVTREEPVCQ